MLDEPNRRGSWRSHVHRTYIAQRVQLFKLQMCIRDSACTALEGKTFKALEGWGGQFDFAAFTQMCIRDSACTALRSP